MKVMFINLVVDYGSTGKVVRELADGLKAKGHEVLIAYGRKQAKNDINTFNMSDSIGFYSHLLMTRLFDRHGLHSTSATKKLINKIIQFQPDVIHLHTLHGYYLNYPILMDYLKKNSNIKVVWTLHDLWAISGSVAHFSYYGCKIWDEGCVIANNPRIYPKSSLFLREEKNFNLKKASFLGFKDLTIVTVSDWQKSLVEKSFLNAYPIVRIYNGIDFDKYGNINHIYKEENTIFGASSDWNEEKNLKDFIKLAKILPTKYKITLAGLSKSQIKSLPSNIKGITRIFDETSLIKLYAKSSVFLNLSLQETMGLTTVEALASGTPVAVYDQTAVPEIIDETVGEVVKAGGIEGLLKAIEKVIERNIAPKVCYEFAKARYNVKRMVSDYEKLFLTQRKTLRPLK